MSATDFPLRADGRGRTALATTPEHVRDLVEAVLFTAPGERVNRPDFGCGLEQFLFGPLDQTIAGTAEIQVRSGLQRWLGDVIDLGEIEVEVVESTLRITVQYRIRNTGDVTIGTFERRV
jgi:phage baseplate assembly protein W